MTGAKSHALDAMGAAHINIGFSLAHPLANGTYASVTPSHNARRLRPSTLPLNAGSAAFAIRCRAALRGRSSAACGADLSS